MLSDKYTLNKEALADLMHYFVSLREQFANEESLSNRELLDYTGLSYASLYRLENGMTKNPQLETIIRLAGYWELSDDQVVEIYKAFCNKDQKLKIVDDNIKFRARKVTILPSKIYNLKKFWHDQRIEKRLTLAQVEDKTGISPAILSNVETGKNRGRSLNCNIILCNLYGVTDSQVVDFYHQVLPELRTKDPVDLDSLTKDELIDIILRQNANSNKYYSKDHEKNKILKKEKTLL